jgi:hypothetical protein
MPRAVVRASIAGLLGFAAPAAWAQLSSVETSELRLLYRDPFQTYLVDHVGRCFENSITFEHGLLSYTPTQKITVLLNDYSDTGNASATGVPRNFLALESAPLSVAYETVSPNERFNWLMNHELVHIATVDQAARPDRRARAVFGGKVMPTSDDPESILYYDLTTPRDAAPRWYHEGIAVFIETWMAGGQGRAQGAYDEMVFRSMVRDGSRFYDPLGLVSEGTKADFQVEVNSYLYGTRFMVYLAQKYSPEAVIRWVSRPDGSAGYYAKNFKRVFGLPLGQAWAEWIEFEKAFQKKNLDAIRAYPTTPYADISPRALGSVSRAFFDPASRKVYVAFNAPGLVAHVGSIALDDGGVTPIVEVKGPVLFTVTSLAWDPERRVLFYTTDNTEYRDIRSLDPATGISKLLLKDARIGALAFDRADRSLWGVRHFNGIATLVRLRYPYGEWTQVRSWPYGEVPYDIDVSADGKLLSAAIGGIDGLHALHVMRIEDLLAGKADPVAKFDFGTFTPSGFIFSDDGRFLYGSSYYTGVSNIFRYELASGRLDALSNTETGFFRPVPLPDGRMLVFRYSGDGFVPATIDPKPLEDVNPIVFLGQQLAEGYPIVKSWKVGSPARVPFEEMVTARGPYTPAGSFASESFYPIVQGYKTFQAVGMRFNFSDPVQIDRLELTASYTPDHALAANERLHAALRFRRYDWKVDARWNGADFYDLFGPTKTSRRGYSLKVGWERALVYDHPRKLTLSADVAYYGNLDVLPFYQNVASPSTRLGTALARLKYENVRSSLGHVDDEKGHRWELFVGASYADAHEVSKGPGVCDPAVVPSNCLNVPSTLIPQLLGTFDVGFQLPLRHSSIWLREAAGIGFGERYDPYAQFFFGAFGNNWVDHKDEQRYREFYAFPGLDLNEVGGRTFVKSIVEWNLPPVRFRRFGTPGFYATWLRPALFVGGLATDVDGAAVRRTLGDAGAQFDIRFTALSRLDMTLSFGGAVAVESGFGPRGEAMISFKVMQ